MREIERASDRARIGWKGWPLPKSEFALRQPVVALVAEELTLCVLFFFFLSCHQVEIVLRVLTRPDMSKLQTIFRNLGTDFDERVLPSITNEVLKAVVAQYNAEELLTKRDEVSAKISRT